MRVVFFMHSFSGYFRQFEPALRELLERGHEVHVARDREDSMRGEHWAQGLRAEHPAFDWSDVPPVSADRWFALKRRVRLVEDYLYFLRPEYGQSSELVRRARTRAPKRVAQLLDNPDSRWRRPENLRRVTRWLGSVDRRTPNSPALRAYIRGLHPDVVLLTPHLMPGSLQQDILRAAAEDGFRTGLCIASWDNLSSKQLIRVVPDVVTVWNDTQRQEAQAIHRLPPEIVAVTGAQVYDPWFDWAPRTREEFCERVGLPASRPFVLYAGGALFRAVISEAQFVTERWLPALRASDDPALRDASVLVRPHPKRFAEWSAADLERFDRVALWPREGRMPVDADARADFYDSIHHSAGVVGLNTSAMIEAGIVGKRVHTLLVPEFEGSQHGTLHFRYLTQIGGGLLVEATSMPEHLEQLARTVLAGGDAPDRNRPFVEAFVRPHGVGVAASSVFADTIERVAALGPFDPPEITRARRAQQVALAPVNIGVRAFDVLDDVRRRLRARRLRRAAAQALHGAIQRATAALREGSDRERELYVAARRRIAPGVTRTRARAARGRVGSAIMIPQDAGFAIVASGDDAATAELVSYAQEQVARMELAATNGSAPPFMRPVPAAPDRSSPLLRVALRPDVLSAVAGYLGTTPLLASAGLYVSSAGDDELTGTQLLHCDPEDTRQVKLVVLCSDVTADNGPLTILGAAASQDLRRRTGYRYRDRLTDAQAATAELFEVEGPAGTMCLVDSSRCFHFGSRLSIGAPPRIVAVAQYLSPHAFVLPRDPSLAAPFKDLARPDDDEFVRLVLGRA